MTHTTHLSINVNKVALVRNTRHLGIPSVVRAAELCLQAGAHGITVHPRPDERHIRPHDVHDLAALLKNWPEREYNIEGNPLQNLMDYIRTVRPHQATFVPDSEDQFTSDHGFDLTDAATRQRLAPLIAECHDLGVRVSLFMDPLPEQMPLACELGADRIELYTEPYAAAHAAIRTDACATACTAACASGETAETARLQTELARYAAAAQAARAAGLQVNAGHDLNQANLTPFLRAVPGVAEVSIGHAFMADALEAGYAATVQNYLRCIHAACMPEGKDNRGEAAKA